MLARGGMWGWLTAFVLLPLCVHKGIAEPHPPCNPTGVNRVITVFTATGNGDHVLLSWDAHSFDPNTLFEVWRSIDGGVTFDSCATDQGGGCVTATFTQSGTYTLSDYGVSHNFKYSYRIWDSEGGEYWYMTSSFQGSLAKPSAPNPTGAPAFTLSELWTDGITGKLKVNLTLTGSPPHGTLWAHNYAVSYYDDLDQTQRTVTGATRGSKTIALGQDPLPPLYPLRNYHIKVRGNGMSANTPYSTEQHVRIVLRPELQKTMVVAGTSILLEWSASDFAPGIGYDVLYQKMSPSPPGSQIVVDAGTARLWNIADLEEQSLYQVAVRARDQWGNPSESSPPVALQTGTASPTDALDPPKALEFDAYPTPFKSTTAQVSFRVALPRPTAVDLAIYDIRGRLVRRVFRGSSNAGQHILTWDKRDDGGHAVGAGIYLARLVAGEKILRQKLVVMK